MTKILSLSEKSLRVIPPGTDTFFGKVVRLCDGRWSLGRRYWVEDEIGVVSQVDEGILKKFLKPPTGE